MKSLSINWFAEGLIDLEHKQYLLLSYLQGVEKHFKRTELYPALSDLIFHFRNLKAYQEQKEDLAEQFPRKLTGFSLRPPQPQYVRTTTDHETIQEIDQIVAFSLKHMEPRVKEGKELYDLVDHELQIETIGLLPLYKRDGYLFVRAGEKLTTHIYRFEATVFSEGSERFGGVHLHAMDNIPHAPSQDYEQLKLQLIRRYRDLPNPATFAAETATPYPIEETLLPVVKRRLIRYVLSETG